MQQHKVCLQFFYFIISFNRKIQAPKIHTLGKKLPKQQRAVATLHNFETKCPNHFSLVRHTILTHRKNIGAGRTKITKTSLYYVSLHGRDNDPNQHEQYKLSYLYQVSLLFKPTTEIGIYFKYEFLTCP